MVRKMAVGVGKPAGGDLSLQGVPEYCGKDKGPHFLKAIDILALYTSPLGTIPLN